MVTALRSGGADAPGAARRLVPLPFPSAKRRPDSPSLTGTGTEPAVCTVPPPIAPFPDGAPVRWRHLAVPLLSLTAATPSAGRPGSARFSLASRPVNTLPRGWQFRMLIAGDVPIGFFLPAHYARLPEMRRFRNDLHCAKRPLVLNRAVLPFFSGIRGTTSVAGHRMGPLPRGLYYPKPNRHAQSSVKDSRNASRELVSSDASARNCGGRPNTTSCD
jgi:hypothetical protein